MKPQEIEKAVLRLISGAIDTHLHVGPESRLIRKQNAVQVARTAREMGMKAIMLKNREYGTVVAARLAQDLVPGIGVFGSYTMDNEAGGLNPGAVLAWIKMGARYIWMPTATAANSKGKVLKSRKLDLPGEGITILDAKGKLKPVVHEILKIVSENDVTLGTGHLSPEEHFVLVEEAIKAGVKRVVLTHVHCDQLTEVILTDKEIVKLVKMGAMVEYCYWTCHNNIYNIEPKVLADSMKLAGFEHCVMSTDFGQNDNPTAPEGLKLYIGVMLENGVAEKDIETMVKKNPAKLLKLE
jgi:microsomal dipeptidase-like Zn-dependent dipeptidase